MSLIKPVYSEPLSVTVPVVIGMVLVGTVVSIPIPPQYVRTSHKITAAKFTVTNGAASLLQHFQENTFLVLTD